MDQVKIVRMNNHHKEYLINLYASLFGFEERELEKVIDYFNDSDLDGFVALIDGNPIGGVLFKIMKVAYSNGRVVFIEAVEVEKKFRCQGIGTQLLKEVIKFTKGNEIKGIEFSAKSTDQDIMKFYYKNGFKPDGWVNMYAEVKDLT